MMHQLWSEDVEEYKKILRMPSQLFEELPEMIRTDVKKERILFREPILAKSELALTLKRCDTCVGSQETAIRKQVIFFKQN